VRIGEYHVDGEPCDAPDHCSEQHIRLPIYTINEMAEVMAEEIGATLPSDRRRQPGPPAN